MKKLFTFTQSNIKEFVSFLKENDALEAYLANVIEKGDNFGKDVCCPFDVFTWGNTPEGYEYWSSLYSKYVREQNMKENPFKDTKVYVGTRSKEVQKKLFKMGYTWAFEEQRVMLTDCPFLFIDEYKHITCVGPDSYEYFKAHKYKEISIEEILKYSL